ncbi:MAG: nicotinate (nicotinamide) nucleotide adenylyltransferase [Flavobacteriaceae bacterium]
MKKIGLYFGTFNPIHNGHLALGEYFSTQTDIDAVWFVVSPQNPFKVNDSLLEDHHRLAMVQLAVKAIPFLEVCEVEFTLPKPNYTIDTLMQLKKSYPDIEFVLLMGFDNLVTFHYWKEYEKILNQVELYVYPRKHSQTLPDLFLDHHKIKIIQAPMLDYASETIRKLILQKKPIRHLMPSLSFQYLEEHQLYSS